jgi:peptide/nickel transport system permease protein
VFASLVLLSVIGPRFWRYSATQITGQFATGPSLGHPFGTDLIGHDLLAQVMAAEATSVKTAVLVAAITTVLGTAVGAVAGYYGALADAVLMRFTDLVLAVPLLAVLLLAAGRLGRSADGWAWIAVILACALWTPLARQVRGAFLTLREREFVEAARAIGAGDARIILRHMLPNALGPVIVSATFTMALAIGLEAVLSFLGLGIQPPDVSLGSLIASGQAGATTLPWLFFFPAGFLVATILAVNYTGDALRDALDPVRRPLRRPIRRPVR